MKNKNGYTLVELIVAVGMFALIMTLAAGAYLIMIGASRSAQATATGINSLSFALEDMVRSVRTGIGYNCNAPGGGDCANGGSALYFTNSSGQSTTYAFLGGALTKNGVALTDSSVTVNASKSRFYVSGTLPSCATHPPPQSCDNNQPNITFLISGTVSPGPGKTTSFSIETGATMRGDDL
ncbi:type II secretion system protein [Candidatus Kaiserbacteria bacterium]|nr:type II secretion system protein [Candidatus Kaiserbacteria bacterium]